MRTEAYDWDRILDPAKPQPFVALEGADFTCRPISFAGAARYAARKRSLEVHCFVRENEVTIWATHAPRKEGR